MAPLLRTDKKRAYGQRFRSATLWNISLGIISMLFVLGFFGLASLELWNDYQRAIAQAKTDSQNFAKFSERNLFTMLDKIDTALLDTAAILKTDSNDNKLTTDEINNYLKQHSVRISEVTSFWITDKTGELKYSGLHEIPKINVSDREFFTVQRDNAQTGLYIGKPILSRISNTWTLPLSRRLNNAEGHFAGILFTYIKIEHLSNLFASVSVKKNGVITLRNHNQELLAMYPTLEKEIGEALPLSYAKGGSYYHTSPIDKVGRMFTFKNIEHYPMTIFVGLAYADYLPGWHRKVFFFSLGTLVVLLFFAYLTFRLIRISKRSTSLTSTMILKNSSLHLMSPETIDILFSKKRNITLKNKV